MRGLGGWRQQAASSAEGQLRLRLTHGDCSYFVLWITLRTDYLLLITESWLSLNRTWVLAKREKRP